MPLGKRKIGCDDVSSEVDAIQELMTDMELACNEQDHVAVERIYERYLAQTAKGVASKCFGEHAPDLIGGGDPPKEVIDQLCRILTDHQRRGSCMITPGRLQACASTSRTPCHTFSCQEV